MRFWIGLIIGLLIGTGGTMVITQSHLIGAFNTSKQVIERSIDYLGESDKVKEVVEKNQQILEQNN